MSAKPRFKPRKGWAWETNKNWGVDPKLDGIYQPKKVRVNDARDLTVERAIAKCINQAWINTDWTSEKACKAICPQWYSARFVNGKVRVRRAKQ